MKKDIWKNEMEQNWIDNDMLNLVGSLQKHDKIHLHQF